jgi:hypothetical protein
VDEDENVRTQSQIERRRLMIQQYLVLVLFLPVVSTYERTIVQVQVQEARRLLVAGRLPVEEMQPRT